MPEENQKPNTFFNVLTEKPIKKPVPVSPKLDVNHGKFKKPAKLPWVKVFLVLLIFLSLIGIGILTYTFIKNRSTEIKGEETKQEQSAENIPEVSTPAEWLLKYFGSETCTDIPICGDKSDPDRDGLSNLDEHNAGADPNNADSDNDGLADGDEVNIFETDPLLSKTYREGEYLDVDFAKSGYDIKTNQLYTQERLQQLQQKVKEKGLHQPSITTLGSMAFTLYQFSDPNMPALPADLDVSPEAKLERDTQRQSTIKKIGAALLSYKAEQKSFPQTKDFIKMADAIKTYNTVATNYNDPINLNPYLYGYESVEKNNFILSYYSETQNQLIKYTTSDAEETAKKENAQANDEKRKSDLENLRNALIVYSSSQLDPNTETLYVFPKTEELQAALVPKYLSSLPTDPVTKILYQYQLGPNADTFTLKTVLQAPVAGTTGYMCNQESCQNF